MLCQIAQVDDVYELTAFVPFFREQKKAAERKSEQEAKAVPSTPAAESS